MRFVVFEFKIFSTIDLQNNRRYIVLNRFKYLSSKLKRKITSINSQINTNLTKSSILMNQVSGYFGANKKKNQQGNHLQFHFAYNKFDIA